MLDDIKDIFIQKDYIFNFTVPDLANRSKTIPYRVNYWERFPTVNWWRTHTREEIERVLAQFPAYTLTSTGSISKKAFIKEIQNSVVTISPFGLGEICYRDFESFINGSLLFKPSINHLRTYPDLYEDGVTYISHKWDFSDFNEKLSMILTAPSRFESIAREGQNRFKMYLNDGIAFSDQLNSLIS